MRLGTTVQLTRDCRDVENEMLLYNKTKDIFGFLFDLEAARVLLFDGLP